jgi:hypothetical protein
LCDFTVSVTNVSQAPVQVSYKTFFPVFDGGGMKSIRSQTKLPTEIQPGQTISEKVVIRCASDENVVSLEWPLRQMESERKPR